MTDLKAPLVEKAVREWARLHYDSDEILVGSAALDDEDEDEADRYLVDFAVRGEGRWLVAEVWLSDDQILSINDIGEGLPLEDVDWPWPSD